MTDTSPRILRSHDVTRMTGLHRATIYRKMADGEFPQNFKLGVKAAGWLESEVVDWVRARSADRGQHANE